MRHATLAKHSKMLGGLAPDWDWVEVEFQNAPPICQRCRPYGVVIKPFPAGRLIYLSTCSDPSLLRASTGACEISLVALDPQCNYSGPCAHWLGVSRSLDGFSPTEITILSQYGNFLHFDEISRLTSTTLDDNQTTAKMPKEIGDIKQVCKRPCLGDLREISADNAWALVHWDLPPQGRSVYVTRYREDATPIKRYGFISDLKKKQ